MRDPAWLDDLEDPDDPASGTPARRVRPGLVVLAALPWLLVIALFVLPGRHGTDLPGGAHGPEARAADPTAVQPPEPVAEPGTPDPAGADDVADEPEAPDVADPRDAAGTGTTDPDPPARPTVDDGQLDQLAVDTDLAAIALLAARSWLSGADRHEDGVALPSRDDADYAEHLHLEGIDGDDDLLVARVIALLLDLDAANPPRLQRIAVPLAATPDGPRLLGQPWELPTPALDLATLSTVPLADPVLLEAADQALREAGFADPQVQRLARTVGWPLIVSFTTGGRPVEQQVWLRSDAGGRLAVAGLDRVAPAGAGAVQDADRTEDVGARP